jgi:hypothetical protein
MLSSLFFRDEGRDFIPGQFMISRSQRDEYVCGPSGKDARLLQS